MQFLYRTRRLLFRALDVRTRGAKIMLFNQAGELLLVRNSYGSSELFRRLWPRLLRGAATEAAAEVPTDPKKPLPTVLTGCTRPWWILPAIRAGAG